MEPCTAPLSWNDAVDAAFVPVDLDHVLGGSGPFGTGAPRVGDDGRVADAMVVRYRAARAYVKAHDGEVAVVQYCDPAHVDDASRIVYRAYGTLAVGGFVNYPTFPGPASIKTVDGLVLGGGQVIPVAGLVSIEAEGDHATVTL